MHKTKLLMHFLHGWAWSRRCENSAGAGCWLGLPTVASNTRQARIALGASTPSLEDDDLRRRFTADGNDDPLVFDCPINVLAFEAFVERSRR